MHPCAEGRIGQVEGGGDRVDVVARHHLVYDVANAEKYHQWAVLTVEKNRFGQDGINQMLEYSSRFDGKNHRSLNWHMFHHVVNHSTYHRGQLTTMLRQLGARGVSTDLLMFDDDQTPD